MPDPLERPFLRYTDGGLKPLGISKGGSARLGYGPPVFALCGFRCAYCDFDMAEPYEDWLSLSVDHVVPDYLARAGWPADWVGDRFNLVTCCRACNEFLNGYRIVDVAPPHTLEEFVAARDRAFDEKRKLALDRHAVERRRYEEARAAGPTEAQQDLEAPIDS
jgi:hypothetical protein